MSVFDALPSQLRAFAADVAERARSCGPPVAVRRTKGRKFCVMLRGDSVDLAKLVVGDGFLAIVFGSVDPNTIAALTAHTVASVGADDAQDDDPQMAQAFQRVYARLPHIRRAVEVVPFADAGDHGVVRGFLLAIHTCVYTGFPDAARAGLCTPWGTLRAVRHLTLFE